MPGAMSATRMLKKLRGDKSTAVQGRTPHVALPSAPGNAAEPSSAAESAVERKSVQELINRIIFTILMAYIFLALISLGIYAGIPIVVFILITMFHEITGINGQMYRRKRHLYSANVIKWYFLTLIMTFTVVYNLRKLLATLSSHHESIVNALPFMGFCGFMLGIVIFVLSLRTGLYRFQFVHFTWTMMTAMFIGTQGAAEISNMMRGMIWFLLPVSCVIINDIWAYVFGKLFGRTKLLALSPKKTIEGFVGAFVVTVLWAFRFCGFLSHFPEMYCPVVSFSPHENLACVRDAVFVQREVQLPYVSHLLPGQRGVSLYLSTAQLHALVLGAFAALLAPFGGFFASGLKRAFRIKDFGDLIPGHGGMTDRMDCQGIMGLFTYFYLQTYVFKVPKCATLPAMTHCALHLPREERLLLLQRLQASL